MSKMVVAEFLTVDGVMEAPENWQFPYHYGSVTDYTQQQINSTDAFLYGRKTYEIFASFWPTQTHNEFGIADQLNHAPKYIVSNTLKDLTWQNSTLISGSVIDAITKLKQQPGRNIGITGSRTLIHSLMKADLIDEYRLLVYPLVVGHGERLFDEGMGALKLKLTESQAFDSGAILLVYQPDRGVL